MAGSPTPAIAAWNHIKEVLVPDWIAANYVEEIVVPAENSEDESVSTDSPAVN